MREQFPPEDTFLGQRGGNLMGESRGVIPLWRDAVCGSVVVTLVVAETGREIPETEVARAGMPTTDILVAAHDSRALVSDLPLLERVVLEHGFFEAIVHHDAPVEPNFGHDARVALPEQMNRVRVDLGAIREVDGLDQETAGPGFRAYGKPCRVRGGPRAGRISPSSPLCGTSTAGSVPRGIASAGGTVMLPTLRRP